MIRNRSLRTRKNGERVCDSRAMSVSSILFCVFLLWMEGPLFPGQTRINPKNLAPQYQDWLKLTTYIIKDKERDVFLQLTNDRDRDLFIQAFWKLRDPTPGTPENEYKDEIIKRFQGANRKFRFGSAREGWMTDRGRIYIILGPPTSTEYIEGSTELYPAEIWSFYGDVSKGMPVHFQLVFYRWRGSGELKLYDPVADGPGRLIIHSQKMDPSDYEAMYDKIYELQPDLASVALSIIPGEIPFGFRPSLESTVYMANIVESPKKGLDERYATHFLNFKGVVSTEYLTNYIESETYVVTVHDLFTGAAFCDFAMAPKKLSLNYYDEKNEYYCGFQVDVSLRAGEKVVYQYSKEFPLTIPEARLADTQSMGVCIADSFPVIEGKFRLTVLLRNTAGKEFSVLESDVEIPAESGRPHLAGPVLGYKLTDVQAGVRLPFQAGDKKMNIDPKYTFSAADQIAFFFSVSGLTEDLWKGGSVGILLKGTKAGSPYQKSLSVPMSAYAFHKDINVIQSLAAAEFPPDYYDLTLILKDPRGNALDERRANFIVSPEKTLSHPVVASKASSLASSFIFYYMLAYQYDQVNENEKAEAMYKKAFSLNPSFLQKIPEYAGFLLKVKKFDEALGLIERIKEDSKLRFQYYLARGRALMGLEKYADAIASFLEGNRIYNSDTGLLNALGTCYFRTRRTEEALNVLNASIKLNPDQADVKKLIEEIQGKKK